MPGRNRFKSEEDFILWLAKVGPRRVRGVNRGIGDDAATVQPGKSQETILTTDLTIEGVHFLDNLHPARAVGHRALARALSDVAAMGGTARFALISLAISRRMRRSWIEGFYTGVLGLAKRYGVALVGGDTAVVDGQTVVDVMVVGEVPQGEALFRSGARPGDHLYVSGRLGLSALGLESLKSRGRRASKGLAGPVGAHLFPQPRLALGQFLRENRLASAMMDLSDGLSTDLRRMCRASGVGARIRAERIPGPEVASAAGKPALQWALDGGEDYELLFSVRPRNVPRVPKSFQGIPLTSIGEVARGRSLLLELPHQSVVPLPAGGYDHFQKSRRTRG